MATYKYIYNKIYIGLFIYFNSLVNVHEHNSK